MAAIVVLIAAAWHPARAHADGGASARSRPSASAPDQPPATPQAYAQRILRALADRHTNNWVRYWQARADCQAVPDAHDAAPLDRALLTLTASLCAQLAPRLGVNPADYSPRGEGRSVGLLLNEPGAAVGYTLFTGYWNHDVFLLDPLGRVAHVWHLDIRVEHAKMLDNGNLMIMTAPPPRNMILEVDPRGNTLWRYSAHYSHHDFLKMPSGNVLLLVRDLKTRDEAIAAGANPEFVHKIGLDADYLVEVRPTGASGGEIVWKWEPWDHLVQDFDPSKENYGAVAEHPELIDLNFLLETISNRSSHAVGRWDWLHTNSVDYNPELDQIMLSPRNFSELWIIDRSATMEEAHGHSGGNGGMGGDLLYRWGNPRAYGQGDADDQRLFWQHQTHWIPSGLPGAGNILLFNNGWEFAGYERFHSSVDEFAPSADDYRRAPNSPYPPLAPEWTYAAETPADFYAPIMSGTQRLPNGNTLIVDGPAGTIFQATPDGKIAWKYIVPLHKRAHLRQGERAAVESRWRSFPTPYGDPVHLIKQNMVYRAYWYPPDYAGLRALDLTPGDFIEDMPDIYDKAYAAAIAGDFGARLASSDFDIYLDGDEDEDENGRRLFYIKQPCALGDADARFFLHIIPVDARDISADRREHGFDNMDFRFDDMGKASVGRCIAIAPLPGYPIDRIRTGQFTGARQLWRADIDLSGE